MSTVDAKACLELMMHLQACSGADGLAKAAIKAGSSSDRPHPGLPVHESSREVDCQEGQGSVDEHCQ